MGVCSLKQHPQEKGRKQDEAEEKFNGHSVASAHPM